MIRNWLAYPLGVLATLNVYFWYLIAAILIGGKDFVDRYTIFYRLICPIMITWMCATVLPRISPIFKPWATTDEIKSWNPWTSKLINKNARVDVKTGG